MTGVGNFTFLSFCYQKSKIIITLQDAAPILNIVVPQSPHFPRVAGRPFFMVTCCGSRIVWLSRHFMQYPVIEKSFPFWPDWLTLIGAVNSSSTGKSLPGPREGSDVSGGSVGRVLLASDTPSAGQSSVSKKNGSFVPITSSIPMLQSKWCGS